MSNKSIEDTEDVFQEWFTKDHIWNDQEISYRDAFKAGAAYGESKASEGLTASYALGVYDTRDYAKKITSEQIKEIQSLKQQLEEMRKELEWAVDVAYYWVDNISDKQKCVDLEHKHKLKIDHSYDDED